LKFTALAGRVSTLTADSLLPAPGEPITPARTYQFGRKRYLCRIGSHAELLAVVADISLCRRTTLAAAAIGESAPLTIAQAQASQQPAPSAGKPKILVNFGDDVGISPRLTKKSPAEAG
jgi:hypothetical protein